MFDRRWTPPPEHWGSALQRGASHLGAVLVDNDRERKARERQTMLDDRAQSQYETSLKLTPGVTEIAPSEPTRSTRGSIIDPANPDAPIQQVNLPGLSGALRTPRGQTMLTDTLAFNPNHQRDQEAAERERVRAAMLPALRETYGENAEAMADLMANGGRPGDVAYQPLSRDQQFADTREATRIGENSQIRVGQAPRWTPPPAPARPELVETTEGFEWATPGQPIAGRPLPPRGSSGQTFASMQLSMKDAMKMAKDEAADLEINPRPDELYAAARRLQRGERAFSAVAGVEPGASGSEENPVLLPPSRVTQRRPSGFGEVTIPPPRRSSGSAGGPPLAPGASTAVPSGTRGPAVLDQAVQFYAPLPANQRAEAMREDGATDAEIQYMLSKIGS